MNKIIFIGDTHKADGLLAKMVADAPADIPIVHVGDIGLWPILAHQYVKLYRPIFFIEGNHDYIPMVSGLKTITEIWPNLIYVPRGTVLELAGKRVGFLGGATSVDRKWRSHNEGFNCWFDGEDVTQADVDRLVSNGPIDLMVTHCPPESIISRNFERPEFLRSFNLPPDWVDPSALYVERAWVALGRPRLICGHMHRAIEDSNVRILDINEVYIQEL